MHEHVSAIALHESPSLVWVESLHGARQRHDLERLVGKGSSAVATEPEQSLTQTLQITA